MRDITKNCNKHIANTFLEMFRNKGQNKLKKIKAANMSYVGGVQIQIIQIF